MIYRVILERHYDKFGFDFNNDNTGGRPDEVALKFMTWALKAYTEADDREEGKGYDFKCYLEAIPEEKDDDF